MPSYPVSDIPNYLVPAGFTVCGDARDVAWTSVRRSGANTPPLSPRSMVYLVVKREQTGTPHSLGWVTRVFGMFFEVNEALEVASILYQGRSLEAHPHGSYMVYNGEWYVGIIRAPLWQMQLEGILIGGQSGALLIRPQELSFTHPISPGN